MDSRNFPYAQSEVYPIDGATRPPSIAKKTLLCICELRINITQYSDNVAPDANADARLM